MVVLYLGVQHSHDEKKIREIANNLNKKKYFLATENSMGSVSKEASSVGIGSVVRKVKDVVSPAFKATSDFVIHHSSQKETWLAIGGLLIGGLTAKYLYNVTQKLVNEVAKTTCRVEDKVPIRSKMEEPCVCESKEVEVAVLKLKKEPEPIVICKFECQDFSACIADALCIYQNLQKDSCHLNQVINCSPTNLNAVVPKVCAKPSKTKTKTKTVNSEEITVRSKKKTDKHYQGKITSKASNTSA